MQEGHGDATSGPFGAIAAMRHQTIFTFGVNTAEMAFLSSLLLLDSMRFVKGLNAFALLESLGQWAVLFCWSG